MYFCNNFNNNNLYIFKNFNLKNKIFKTYQVILIGNPIIKNLIQNGKNRGVTLGAFVMSAGTISGGMPFLGKVYSSPTSGWHYHEAFHAVFRML